MDALGLACVLDPPVADDHAEIGQCHRLLLVVGDVDESGADALLDRLELVLHLATELEVEGAERLVEEQHRRLDHERARSATRWRWPPESSCGLRSATCSSPTSASASFAARRRSARPTPRIISPKPTLAPTLMWGNSA